jgi:murein DD-endopeptidase MepM/ murein hydrolase activator NlpD
MRRHPILGYNKMHRGLDFAAPRGTPVMAAGDGVIERIGRYGAYGKYIRIRHSGTYKTAYAHLSGYARGMKTGKRVRQGQVIGHVGTTGRSTGPHLHYEVLRDGGQINPLRLRLPTGQRLVKAELAAFKTQVRKLRVLFAEVPEVQRVARQ